MEPREQISSSDIRAILDTIPGLAWSVASDGSLEFSNQAWQEYTGLAADSGAWNQALHPDDVVRLQEYWHSEDSNDTNARLRSPDGEYASFLIRRRAVTDASGSIIRWYATASSASSAITVPVAVINSIPTFAWSTTPDGVANFLNQRWLDYTGLSLDQALGYGWTTAVHPDDMSGIVAYWRSLISSGESGEYEARLRRVDGVYRWFLFRAEPYRDPSGRIVKWYGTNTDIEDFKQANEALRASERNLRATINAIPTPAWSTRPDGHVEFLNQRWLDYAGMTAEQAQGWGWGTVIHPDDRNTLARQWELCLASGTAAEVEARHRRFDGVYRWFLVRAHPLHDESGNVVKWYGTTIDIEDRKQADEALRASERNLRAIINTIPTLSWSTRPDGYVEFLSERWLGFTGLSEEKALGFGWAVAIYPGDAQHLLEYWTAALESGTEVDVEARLRRFDGVYRWFLFRASPLRDQSGQIVSWYGTNIDIEDRKQAAEALRASERDLGRIIETIPGFVWCATPAGEFNYLNQRILDYTGAALADWTNGGWANYLHPDDAGPTLQAWSNAVAIGQPQEIQCRFRRSDGQYRWFHMLGEAARDGQGVITRWYGLLLDIDDQITIGETLRNTEVRLSRATQIAMVGEMSASIAHEINQPLAAVVASGYACRRFLLTEPPNLAGAREAAESIVRDGKDAADVIRRIRALFKRAAVEKTMLNVNDVIGEVLRLLAGEIAKRRVSVETNLAKDLPAVPGDRLQLQQLTSNLLLNGIEAMDSINNRPRKLSIRSLSKDPGTVLVEVTDSGVGIENPEKAFEAFVTTKESGMGMGLTICRSIIEAHQGRLWVSATPAPGATVCFTLPTKTESV